MAEMVRKDVAYRALDKKEQRIRDLEAEVQRLQKQLDTAYMIIDTVGMEALWAALTPQEER